MKNVNFITTAISALFLVLVSGTLLHAQDDRIDRDIRIAEGILTELFSDLDEEYPLPGRFRNRVQGEFIPGYGIHFKIDRSTPGQITRVVMRGYENRSSGDEAEDTAAKRERIEEKITDYFLNYAGVIRGLQDSDHIRLTYGSGYRPGRVLMLMSGADQQMEDELRISGWVPYTDLRSHRDGSVSDNQLRNRIMFYDFSDSEEKADLNIFASVLQSAIQNAGTEQIRISRKPSVEFLPEMGAHFHVHLSAGHRFMPASFGIADHHIDVDALMEGMPEQFQVEIPRMAFSIDSLRMKLSELNGSLDGLNRELKELRVMNDSLRTQPPRVMAFQTAAPADTLDLSAEAEMVMDTLREVIRDYGPTLSSLSDSEWLMITVHWPSRDRNLPERTYFRITKSDLLAGMSPDIREVMR
jgi:hypothetical protein